MITEESREYLKSIKPALYKKKVREHLLDQGKDYSENHIRNVFLGERENVEIETAIVEVFNEENEKKLAAQQKLEKKLKELSS